MSIVEKIQAFRGLVVGELEKLAAEAEKIAPVVVADAKTLASDAGKAIETAVVDVVEKIAGCCSHVVSAHGPSGCTAPDCKCTTTAAGAKALAV